MDRAGQFISVLSGSNQYKAYKPNPLPSFPELEMDEELVNLLSNAHESLGKLDAVSNLVPNLDLFISSYVRKEALISSQIEGTQATLEDVLNSDITNNCNLDVNDVLNYVNALNYAIKRMENLPICNRLLCDTHKVLLQGVRGQEKFPGEFRRSQNWIGATNSNINTARYVPPTVEDMKDAMSDLEKFINDYDMDILLKTALVHYQFETIHPFLDGNGRIGRMLIVLMLLSNKILSKPVLYLSLYLKTNRVEYYDRLSEVRKKGDYEQWIKFFLLGINQTSLDCIETIKSIDTLLKDDENKINIKSQKQKLIFDYIKQHPIVSISKTSKDLDISFNTVSIFVTKLVNLNILKKTSNKERDKVFEYTNYIEVLKQGI